MIKNRLTEYNLKKENNYNKHKKKGQKLLFSLILFFLSGISIGAQSLGNGSIRVGILPIINQTNLEYIDTLTENVEENIFFTAEQLKSYSIIDGRNEKISQPGQISRLKKIAQSKGCDFLIAGEVIQKNGTWVLSLILFDSRTEKIITTKEAPFFRMIEVFDVSDRLTISLLEELTGERIKRGIVYFINQTPGTKFEVNVNRKKLEENSSSVTLIEGTYTIRIFNTTNRRKKVLTQKVDVKEGIPVRINFDLSENQISYDKKNTLRTNIYGMKLFFSNYEIETGRSDSPVIGGGFIFPAFSYTRLFSEKAGMNIAMGMVFVPNDKSDTNSEESIGLNIRGGPYFRLGRIGITPMIGGTILFSAYNLGAHQISDYFLRVNNGSNSISFIYTAEITVGFEFFFTPMFSLYGDVGFEFGEKQRIEPDETYLRHLIFGFNASIMLGISF